MYIWLCTAIGNTTYRLNVATSPSSIHNYNLLDFLLVHHNSIRHRTKVESNSEHQVADIALSKIFTAL